MPAASFFNAVQCSTTTSLCNPPLRVINPSIPTIGYSSATQRLGNGQVGGHSIHFTSSSEHEIDSSLIEANDQFVNWTYETFYAIDSLPDSLTIAYLTDIAYQHPYYGGRAVYYARAMLNLDIEDRLNTEKKRNKENNISSEDTYMFFPNPSSGGVTLQSRANFTLDSKLVLYDVLNRVVKKITLPERINICVFDVRDLPSGIYTGKIDGKTDEKLKLVIVK